MNKNKRKKVSKFCWII